MSLQIDKQTIEICEWPEKKENYPFACVCYMKQLILKNLLEE